MNKVYSRIIWKNYPNTSTAINETNLNRMDKAIDDLDNRVIEQDSTKANQTTVNNMVKNWTMDETTGVITVEKQDGSKIMFDLNIEKIPVTFELSPSGILTMTTSDGTQFTANIGSMIPVLTFNESDQIAVSVSGSGVNKTYSFSIKDNSITEDKLQPNFLADIKVQSANASLSANNAETSATQAQSYAIGGTGTRENEDTDNAMYYYEQAKQTDIGQISSKVDEINSKLSKQLGSHTVKSDVPENAVFTDTVYDDTEVKESIDELNSNLSDLAYGDNGGYNIFKDTTWIVGKHITENGINDYDETGSAYSDYISIVEPNTYYISSSTHTKSTVFEYDANKSFIKHNGWKKYNNTPCVLSGNCAYIRISFNGASSNIQPSNVMLAKTPNLPYEPYIPSVKMLAEENTQQSAEMMDIKMLGWSVPKECPIQNEVNGNQFIQKVGRTILNGTEDWTYHSGSIGINGSFYTNFNGGQKPLPDGTGGYFTRFKTGPINGADMNAFVGADTIQLRVDDCTAPTFLEGTSKIKQWLSQNNTAVYYELATPITTTIDGNEKVVKLAEDVADIKNDLAPKKIELQNVDERVTIQDNGSFIINGVAFVNLLVTFNETLPQWSNFVRLPRPKGDNISVHCENSVILSIYSQDNLPGDCGTTENVASGTEIRLLVNYEVA